MHDALTIGLPILVILAGILLNRQEVSSLRADVRSELSLVRAEIGTLRSDITRRFDSVDARFDTIHRDMREFYAEQARHDQRITSLERS